MSQTLRFTAADAPADAGAALAALAWLVEAGIDTLVSNSPATWLAASVAPEADVAPTPPRPSPVVAPPVQGSGALAARAAVAPTLDVLAALANEVAVERGSRVTLFADGNPHAPAMVLGDAPSPDDIAAGRLFAGDSGQLLDRMLAAIGRDRADTYLANVQASPAGGRTLQPHDIAAGLPIVRRQIELVRPHAILVLGGVAASALLGVDSGINRLRGRWQTLQLGDVSVPVLPTFAPAYLLAHPAHKALAWRDLLLFKAALAAYTAAS